MFVKCLYNEWRGILGWRFDLHAFLAKSWKEQKSISFRSVPFVLVEATQRPSSGFVNVSLEGSAHPLPLTTVYHQLHPVQPTAYTFFQVIFGNGYPVALLDEEKILPVGKEITAVGICRIFEGSLEIRSCPDLPCFL
ncbi:E3 ubiquitin-protein ligase SPL2-like [Asparagus officinalis]|uniref:E3 ubiquitin-protein ligase SPL2-like n=1 Tax=Asparagus officinalis TaxID=4686 RepID=UPI00098E39A1|nr:E3 ubiquitin-protein ligase SPL2-like [Asparagus officinalis]